MGIQDSLQKHFAGYGYEIVDTPIVEPARLFLTKAGDQVIDRLFVVMHGDQEFVLRPEFTASAANKYIRENHENAVRWQFRGPVFQDIPGDSTRRFQRQSMGAELIGLDNAYADAEIIAAAGQGLDLIGVGGWKATIGHVGLTRYLLDQFNLDKRAMRFLLGKKHLLTAIDGGKDAVILALDEYLSHHLDSGADEVSIQGGMKHSTEQMLNIMLNSTNRGTTLGGRTREEIALRLIEKQRLSANRNQIVEAIDFLAEWSSITDKTENAFHKIESFIKDDVGRQMLTRWMETVGLLADFNIDMSKVLIKPDLARTWDYYTGIVFELVVETGVHVGGGGRYDELARLIGSKDSTPSVGFGYDVTALADYVKETKSSKLLPIIVHDLSTVDVREVVWWAQKLRQHHIATVVVTRVSNSNHELNFRGRHMEFEGKEYERNDFDRLLEQLEASGL